MDESNTRDIATLFRMGRREIRDSARVGWVRSLARTSREGDRRDAARMRYLSCLNYHRSN